MSEPEQPLAPKVAPKARFARREGETEDAFIERYAAHLRTLRHLTDESPHHRTERP